MPPQLATLVGDVPGGPDWIHEAKYDGYRIEARVARAKVSLMSRRGNDWTGRFQGIADELASRGFGSAIFDGEVVALDPAGLSSFQLLQRAFHGGAPRVVYVVFDLLWWNGRSLRPLPLTDRRAQLARIIGPA